MAIKHPLQKISHFVIFLTFLMFNFFLNMGLFFVDKWDIFLWDIF